MSHLPITPEERFATLVEQAVRGEDGLAGRLVAL